MKKTNLPVYTDGKFHLYEIITPTDNGDYPIEKLKDLKMEVWFEVLNIFDNLKIQFDQAKINVTLKIKIPQYKKINSLNVLKIDDNFYQVFNAQHYFDKDGFSQTEITLKDYQRKDI